MSDELSGRIDVDKAFSEEGPELYTSQILCKMKIDEEEYTAPVTLIRKFNWCPSADLIIEMECSTRLMTHLLRGEKIDSLRIVNQADIILEISKNFNISEVESQISVNNIHKITMTICGSNK